MSEHLRVISRGYGPPDYKYIVDWPIRGGQIAPSCVCCVMPLDAVAASVAGVAPGMLRELTQWEGLGLGYPAQYLYRMAGHCGRESVYFVFGTGCGLGLCDLTDEQVALIPASLKYLVEDRAPAARVASVRLSGVVAARKDNRARLRVQAVLALRCAACAATGADDWLRDLAPAIVLRALPRLRWRLV